MIEAKLLKTELQTLGVRIPTSLLSGGRKRKGGAGPAEGVVIYFNGTQASVPCESPFVLASPYFLSDGADGPWLVKNGERVCPVEIPDRPSFYEKKTEDGVPYSHIALLHGKDCLGSTIDQSCAYWAAGRACRFCGIGLSYQRRATILRKNPSQLAEVARAAKAEGAAQVVLTCGSGPGALDHLSSCARAICEKTGLPIQGQHMPFKARDPLKELAGLKVAGFRTLAINIESPDMKVLGEVSPHKAALGWDGYRRSWREAVGMFGRNQVVSFLIVGLGESDAAIIEAGEEMAGMGVYPHLLPLRPIPGTYMGSVIPPSPERMARLYEACAAVLLKYGLTWRNISAGCGRCTACSALSDFEDAQVTCTIVVDDSLRKCCFDVRQKVFVEEQGIFQGSDRDDHDPGAVHIAALLGRTVIGTVRVHEERAGIWWGGRLAVLPRYRGRIGRLLVKKAEEVVKERGGRRFLAHVRTDVVGFFLRCGWRRTEPDSVMVYGSPHALMEAWPTQRDVPGLPLGRIKINKR